MGCAAGPCRLDVVVTPSPYGPDMSTNHNDIVRIAERRQDLITRGDLERLGLSKKAIQRRLAAGQLRPVAPGVYTAMEVPDGAPRRELALCLAYPDAVISHESAARYWGVRRAPKDRAEITVPKGFRLDQDDAVVHYSSDMPANHVVELADGSRITSVARMVFDLGGVLDAQAHASVIEDVRNRSLCSDAELGEVYEDLCRRGRRGSAAFVRLAGLIERAARPTMSEIELELHAAMIAAGLPPAVQQHPVTLPSGRTVYLDLAYVDCMLDIEVDHSEWHATPSAVERDKARDVGLAIVGWERLRFTERSLDRSLRVCVAQIEAVRTARLARLRPTAA